MRLSQNQNNNNKRVLFSLARHWLALLSMLSIFIFSFQGCSSGTDSAATQSDSELVISLTDAEGDFLSYTVDVNSIKMLKANGAEVEALPLTTQLDFAQYVEVTEFLTAATVPSGHYRGAQIVLDFSNANIVVQGENGEAINATVQDVNGDPVTQLTVDISFNGESDFVIAPGIPAHITLDFDLNASNEVVINGTEATVVVKPVLLADTLLEAPKPHRLRGLLGRVNEAENTFSVVMRPFRHRLHNRFGQLNVHVSENTSYEINGDVYGSDTGLAQLAEIDPTSAVVVYGKLSREVNGPGTKRQFNAIEVYAGSSVPWGTKDIVSGYVISRTGDDLTLRGATLIRADGSFEFSDNISIALNEITRVVKQADTINRYSTGDISVGQHILVLGNITESEQLSLDAEHVRMLLTSVGGSIVTVSPLTVDLQLIDRLRVMQFDFSGTGSSADTDADAANYEVNTGTLSLSGLQMGDPVRVGGHMRPFGSAPEDFDAQTVVDASNMRSHLVVGFAQGSDLGSANAISDISESGLLVNLQEAGDKHHMYRAGISTDLLSLISMPVIAPLESGRGLFVIVQGRDIQVFTTYSDFQRALTDMLNGSVEVQAVQADGVYNADLNRLVSHKISVRLVADSSIVVL